MFLAMACFRASGLTFALAVLALVAVNSFSSVSASGLDLNSTSGFDAKSALEIKLQLLKEETAWYNDIVLGHLIPGSLRAQIPHTAQTWLRNYLAGLFLYFTSGALWCLYIYKWKRHIYFPNGGMPTREPIMLQIWVSMKAMPIYVSLPTLSEYMIENGWTRCYPTLSEMGYFKWAILTLVYLSCVEFGIYWAHRLLHDIKPAYKYLHAIHHIYNKEDTLSPFAGLAFHPIDGIIQASPHVIFVFLVPTHFFTHELCLFAESIWTTNIHDCLHGKIWPVMGAGYHTIHHTTYRHNYGHYTVWMDWMFGTLRDPCEPVKSKSS